MADAWHSRLKGASKGIAHGWQALNNACVTCATCIKHAKICVRSAFCILPKQSEPCVSRWRQAFADSMDRIFVPEAGESQGEREPCEPREREAEPSCKSLEAVTQTAEIWSGCCYFSACGGYVCRSRQHSDHQGKQFISFWSAYLCTSSTLLVGHHLVGYRQWVSQARAPIYPFRRRGISRGCFQHHRARRYLVSVDCQPQFASLCGKRDALRRICFLELSMPHPSNHLIVTAAFPPKSSESGCIQRSLGPNGYRGSSLVPGT